MNRIIRGLALGFCVLGLCWLLSDLAHVQGALKKCTGACQQKFYYKIKNIKATSITDSNGQAVGKDDKNYDSLVNEISKRQMGEGLKSDLETSGETVTACKKGCTCNLKKPVWTNDDKKGTNKGTDSHSVKGHYAGTNGDYTWNFDVEYTARQTVTGTCEGEEAEDASFATPQDQSTAMLQHLLPEGATFAVAQVEPETTIAVEEAGYAVYATADVVKAKRVNPGDHLDAGTTSSIMFDSGTGMLINVLKKARPLTATVGLIPLLAEDHAHPLPLNNGAVTTFIGSDRPFAQPAIRVDNVNKLPDVTHATFLNKDSAKVGELCSFKDLKPPAHSDIAVRTLDQNGATLREQKVTAGSLDGSPQVSFNKPVYKTGERGQLHIGNQENYKRVVETTRFGDASKLESEPIRLVQLSDIKGLPATAPFSTTVLNFQTTSPGEARVAVYMPRAVPPKRIAKPGNEVLVQSNDAYAQWCSQVGASQ